ncbi:MAG: hypothetical protein LBC83_02830 [Oscillospiraceae bacterium]|nr:hypothetical protein [Oscillospiraceae bacterium]
MRTKKSFSAKKKGILIAAACVLALAVGSGIYFGVTKGGITLAPAVRSYVININNAEEVAGFVDYVFVGRVEKQMDARYEDVFERESEDGEKTLVGAPYTLYEVTVLENLKGNLKVNEPIRIEKEGGISMDGKFLSVAEGDSLPEEGSLFVFAVSAGADGSLLANHNYKLMKTKLTEKAIGKMQPEQLQKAMQAELEEAEAQADYKRFAEACKNEVPFARERYTASAEWLEAATQ